MLITLPDILSPEQIRQCRQALADAEWVDGRATAGHLAVQAKQNLQLALDHPLTFQLGEVVLQALGRCPAFIAAALPLRILPPRFNRYEAGGNYGNHIDNAVFHIAGTRQQLRSDISTTLFLSDPDEYDGGELVIEDTYGQQHIKLPAGHAVVYPGTSLHRVTPVTRGTRFASFFWTQSLVRHEHRRAILWELDQSIQRLTTLSTEHETLSRLSGIYHNLLREWSET